MIQQREAHKGVVVLTPDEIRAAIHFEAEARMGISGDQFIRRWLSRDLPDTAATSEIGILVRLLDFAPEDRLPLPTTTPTDVQVEFSCCNYDVIAGGTRDGSR